MAVRRAPKPTALWVEIESDEEAPPVYRLKGAARGLNVRNVIASSATLSVESTNPSTATSSTMASGKHVTRGARNGRPSVNYDMKLHPMDFVIRPNSAAVRRRSDSDSFSRQRPDDESDASSLTSLGSSENEDEISSDSPVHQVAATLPQRKPDPRASRHSSRAEAKKPVNYSKKHHPQDYGLPGHRHSAIMPPPVAQRDTPKPHSQQKRKPSRRADPDSDEEDENAVESISARLSDDDIDVDDDGQGVPQTTATRQPLRSLDSNSRPAKRPRRIDGSSSSPQVIISISSTRNSSSSDMDMDVDDVNHLVDTFTTASDSPRKISSQAEASSVTLDGNVGPNTVRSAPCLLAIVRPYLGRTAEAPLLPSEQHDGPRAAGEPRSDSLIEHSNTVPSARTLSEQHSGSPRESERRDANEEVEFQGRGKNSDEHITPEIMVSPIINEVQHDKAPSETMSEPCDQEVNGGTTDEQRKVQPQQLSHFEEAMAVTEPSNEQSSQAEGTPPVVPSSLSVTSDPIDLLPKLSSSSCDQSTTSSPSDEVEVALPAVSSEL